MERNLQAQERLSNLQAADLERKQRGVKLVDTGVSGAHLRAAIINGVYPAPSKLDLSRKLIGTTRGNAGALGFLRKALKNARVIRSAFAPTAIRGLTIREIVPNESYEMGVVGPYTITRTFKGTHLTDLKLEELYIKQENSNSPLTAAERSRLDNLGVFIIQSISTLKKLVYVVFYVFRLFFGHAATVTLLCQTLFLWV